jgi:protein involved in polysaccharide export with SLBB domain
MKENFFKFRISVLFITCLMVLSLPVDAQLGKFLDNSFISGAKKNELDTLHAKTAKDIADETSGLLEKEIDPDKYIIGPNDVLFISIVTSKTIEEEVVVSPDGKILISGIGIIDVKGKSLRETEQAIKECVDKVYKSHVVYVALKKLREFKVIVSGLVSRPTIVKATAADRVSEVIDRAGGLKYNASVRNITLIRGDEKKVLNVDLLKFNIGDKDANPTVLGGDQIFVPPNNEKNSIQIWGEVGLEGVFEYVPGDSLSTLVKFAHGLLNSALFDSIEFTRFENNNAETDRKFLNLSSWKDNLFTRTNLQGDFALYPGDRVFVRSIPSWQEKRTVIVLGEIMLPGKYVINKEDTRVYDVLKRAGGPTDEASLESSILTRQKEIDKIDREMKRLESIPSSEMSQNERRYFQARSAEQKGVMAINFVKIWENPNSADNIFVIDQDSIYIPSKKIFVNVQGRVNNPGLVVFKAGNSYLDYINQAGGFGFRADEGETIIVKKKGEQYLAKDMNYILEPGDNILVPPLEEISSRQWWYNFITITSQVVTILASFLAIKSLIK